MKKLSVLFLSLVALGSTVVSCSKDEAEPSTEGKWIYDTVSITNNGQTTDPVPANDAKCSDKSYIYLKAAGNLEMGNVNSSTDETAPCALNIVPGTWKSENGKLKLTTSSGSSEYPIISLTKTNLVFKYVNPSNASQYMTITLKR